MRCAGPLSILLFSPIFLLSSIASAAPPDGPRMQAGFVERVLANTFDSPISIAVAPDGRVFVCEQRGTLRVIKNDTLLVKPFATIAVSTTDEEGLLAVTFDPAFATNGYVYIAYTVQTPTVHNRISRLTASGDTALAGSMVNLFDLDTHIIHWHLGGALHMGPDGKLWHSQGDDGYASNAQDMTTTFGKILRINTDGSIPTDNPFYGSTTGRYRAIWAKGLRNPFTFAFQPGTGLLYINDVGENTWEEVDRGVAGGDYAWPGWEGPGNPAAGVQNPVHSYQHTDGCAITGGTFYNPATATFPASYVGKYFYAEYCENQIRMIDPASPASYTVFGPTIAAGPVDLRVGPGGDLYYLSRGNSAQGGGVGSTIGMVVKVSYSGGSSPSIAQHPANRLVTVGQTAQFSVVANGAPTLTYQWQKNGGDITGATGASYTTPATVLADSGSLFRCIVTNGYGSVASNAGLLEVTSNLPPVPVIATPVAGQHYNAGTTLSFSGSASDPEEGPLPASALTWWIDFQHDQHSHPGMPATSGISSGTYQISNGGEKSPNVWFRVFLQARDALGRTANTYVDVPPNLAQITLATSPAGLQLKLDGQPVATPYSVMSAVGMLRTIGAEGPQVQGSVAYSWRSWSDELLATHAIATPATNTTYTALYAVQPTDTIAVATWNGDYVGSDSDLRGYTTPVQFNVPLAGGYTGARWHIPYSDTSPLNPVASDGVGTNWRFYGGLLMESYTNSFSYKWAEIRNMGALDQQQSSGPPGTRGWDLRYWKKPDFLNGAADGIVSFGPASRLEMKACTGPNNVPTYNTGFARFVVRDGTQFWVSRDSLGPASVERDWVLTAPGSRQWARYSPSAPYGIAFNRATAVYDTHTFANITAIGYLHSNDNVAPPATGARSGFAHRGVLAFGLVTNTVSAPEAPPELEPGMVSLAPCSPNPALDRTTLSFRLGSAESVKLEVFDVAGHRVAQLLDGPQPAGEHRVAFQTRSLPAGLYFVRFSTTSRVEWRKLTRLR